MLMLLGAAAVALLLAFVCGVGLAMFFDDE
jgi:hypothetical protein